MEKDIEDDTDSRRRLLCVDCGSDDFEGQDDGFFYCSQCGYQSKDVIVSQADGDDVYGREGGVGALYSSFHSRLKSQSISSSPNPKYNNPLKEEIRSQSVSGGFKEDSAACPSVFEDSFLSSQNCGCKDPVELVDAMRLRYVRGLQIMLQLQCEALVQKFEVCPLICPTAMSIWLKYVSFSKILDNGWVERVNEEAKKAVSSCSMEETKLKELEAVTGERGTLRKIRAKLRRMELDHTKAYYHKAAFISFRSLRKMIPVYTTLAISFLSCHIAREAILPTDIYKWITEAKLPYLSAFIELEKYLGASKSLLVSSRLMFRPIRIISASFLEVTAASIARSICLRTPSVNFYAIALRYLNALSLPVAKILPQACRLYEWSLPSELWLSCCISALPTRVYVMSILIVSVRIFGNIHGHGVWERSILDKNNGHKHKGAAQEDDATQPSTTTDSPCSQVSEFCTKELLQVLDTAYHRMSTLYDYSKDLRSFLKHCGDVIFTGLTPSYEQGKLIERLGNVYDNIEVMQIVLTVTCIFFEPERKRPRDGESTEPSMSSKK
ncbi:TATA box-binding protein-associated factor RNA polymerase I subunit B [Platanthera guangdongensis]|uniref:TATA box-binding protein-associated factor RNA polymerase I subunit B n=1 Tax=Platanthera guangdongensis TaxID=2320717 RepID=A0ABR2N2J6_9ASPA